MRCSVFCGTSVDGFIARRNDALDFLDAGGEEPHGYDEFIATVDVIVMGRRTFDVVAGFEPWPYLGRQVVVLSSKPVAFSERHGDAIERMEGEPREIVAELERAGRTHAYIDGGITIQRFIRAGLIDHMTITRVPILIGDGIPLFGSLPHDVRVKLVETRSFPGGLAQSTYELER